MPAEKTPEELQAELEEQQRQEADRLAKEKKDKEEFDKLSEEEKLERLVQERFKGLKGNLDTAYQTRDAALQELETLKAEKRQRELKDLEEAGKHREAAAMREADLEAKIKKLEAHNTELARDNAITGSLGAYTFRNDKAREMAVSEIRSQLVQNEAGAWVHKSGDSIPEAVKAFLEHEDNSFLLKAKVNSGSGTDKPNPTTPVTKGKSLFDLPQAEVLKLAREGKLPKR